MNPSLLPVALIVLAVLLLAWALGASTYRLHPWGIAGWLPLTGLAGFGTLAYAGMVLDSCSLGEGASAGFAAAGAAMAMALFLPVPLFFGLCIYIRPRGPHSDWAILWGSAVLAAAVAFALHFAPSL
jgi:hypothetical protein